MLINFFVNYTKLFMTSLYQSKKLAVLPVKYHDNIRSCNNCKHAIPYDEKSDPYYHDHDRDERTPSCNFFKYTDVISGRTKFEYASVCRKDETLCGFSATRFERVTKD